MQSKQSKQAQQIGPCFQEIIVLEAQYAKQVKQAKFLGFPFLQEAAAFLQ
jgi:hypothetical protein